MRELSSNVCNLLCMRHLVGHCKYLILVYIFRLALRFGFGDFNFLQALACSPNTLRYHCDDGAPSFSVIQCLTGEAFSVFGFGVCHDQDNSHTTDHAFEHCSGARLGCFCCSVCNCSVPLIHTVPLQHSCNYGVKEYLSVCAFDATHLFRFTRAEAATAV